MESSLMIPAKITPELFRRFALFDAFTRQKRWRRPLLFAALMAMFAAVCFFSRREGSVLLGTVLLSVGLILPAVYVGSFLLSVRKQAKQLDGGKIAYTIYLEEDGVRIVQGKDRAELKWPQLLMAYRVPGCVYLYAGPRRAFLLPEAAWKGDVWAFLKAHLSASQQSDRR